MPNIEKRKKEKYKKGTLKVDYPKALGKRKLKDLKVFNNATKKEQTHYLVIEAIGLLMDQKGRRGIPSIPEIMEATNLSRRAVSDHLAILRTETARNLKTTVQKMLIPHLENICKRVISMSSYNPSSQKLYFDLLGYNFSDGGEDDTKDTNINILINKKQNNTDPLQSKDKVIDI
jgi:hypothetical protein